MEKQEFIPGAEEVLEYFYELSRVPRRSGDNKAASGFLLEFAAKYGLEAELTGADNVIIRKKASPGMEDAVPVILEAHYDMVCEKEPGCDHDFEGPLELTRDGDRIYAKGTTLGADNGLGVAAIMALLAGDYLHPPVEALFTSSEETDMAGARSVDMSRLNGKILMTLDSHALLACGSGELELEMSFDKKTEDAPEGCVFRRISAGGLRGGHTGSNVMDEPGNAIMLVARILGSLAKEMPFRLAEINGGNGSASAYAREAECVIACREADTEIVKRITEEAESTFRKELEGRSDNVRVTLSEAGPADVMTEDSARSIIFCLNAMPDGIHSLSHSFENSACSSSNCGVIETCERSVRAVVLIRSSIESFKYRLLDQISLIASAAGASVSVCHDLPQWDMNVSKEVLDAALNVYEDLEPEMSLGTLECGVFQKKAPEMMLLGIGIPYYYQHSPSEHAYVSEIKEYWGHMLKLLEMLGNIHC